MASPEALAIQREQFEREQHERLERIEAQLSEILTLLRSQPEAANPEADGQPASEVSVADDTQPVTDTSTVGETEKPTTGRRSGK